MSHIEEQKTRLLSFCNRLELFAYNVPNDKRTVEFKAMDELLESEYIEIEKEFTKEDSTIYFIKITKEGREHFKNKD